MTLDQAVYTMGGMFQEGLKVVSPLLIVTLVTGIAISIFQVVTQIQEMTLTFVPKIFVSLAVLYFFGHWMLSSVSNFAKTMILSGGLQ